MMVVDSTGLTDTMTDREWPPCLASGTIGSSEAARRAARGADDQKLAQAHSPPSCACARGADLMLESRAGAQDADGARGEAWRPLTVSHGVSETGTIEYHHRVIHPGRGGS